MSKGVTDSKNYNDIANAIIAKGGSITPLKPNEMADAIYAIPQEGGTSPLPTQTKTITPTKQTQEATPDSGYTLSKVTVNPIPTQYVDTSDANAMEDDILQGKNAYVNGEKVNGSIVNRSSANVSTAFSTDSSGNIIDTVIVQSGNYKNGVTKTPYVAPSTLSQTLIPSNIRAGVKVFDVVGNYSGTSPDYERPSIVVSENGTISATANGLSSNHVLSPADDPEFVSGNIANGVTIFGVTGSFSGATPTYEIPTIEVSKNGLITARANGLTATHQLSSADDAGFIPSRIADGYKIFGIEGTYKQIQTCIVTLDVYAPSASTLTAYFVEEISGGQLDTNIDVGVGTSVLDVAKGTLMVLQTPYLATINCDSLIFSTNNGDGTTAVISVNDDIYVEVLAQ